MAADLDSLAVQELAALEELAALKAKLAGFRERQRLERYAWRQKARPEQLPPEGEWRTWYVRGGRGAGKLLCVDTPIPTPQGWAPIGKLSVGDEVFDEAGRACRVTATHDAMPETAYRLTFSDGAVLDACAEHQWVTWTHAERKAYLRSPYEDATRMPDNWPAWRLRRLVGGKQLGREQVGEALALHAGGMSIRAVTRATGFHRAALTPHLLAGRYISPPEPRVYPDSPGPQIRTTQELADTLTIGKRGDTNHSVPVCGPLELPERDLPIHPYVLGCWLGDGTSVYGEITCDDPEIIEHIQACGVTVTPQSAPPGRTPRYWLGLPEGGSRATGSVSVHSLLRITGMLGNKHVPDAYLRASAPQRLALLQGLMDTDGHAADDESFVEFSSTRQPLADGVAELARSLGMKPVIKEDRARLNGRDCGPRWRVTWCPTVQVFRLTRKADRIRFTRAQAFRKLHRMIVSAEPIEPRPMRCISVDSPNRMYLCGEAMIPTHKTWTASHVLSEWIMLDPEPGEWGVVAPTYQDAWSICIEGESGLLAAFGTTYPEVRAGQSELVEHWHRSFAEMRLRSGHIIRVASAQDGGLHVQGKNLKGLWGDEIGLWDNWETTWNESIRYAVRKSGARIIATGTPKQSRKARMLVRLLLNDPAVPVARLRTIDNAANLSPSFIAEVVGKSKGTRLERQELEGEFLNEVEGALWTAEVIDDARVSTAPDLTRVVVAIDPAVTSGGDSDETGIIVAGDAGNGHGYVLADYSMRGTPDACMKKAVWAYREHKADRIVAEANNGADYIGSLLRTVDPDIPYRKVTATRGKAIRAEPVSALYEQGRIHHVGLPGPGRPDVHVGSLGPEVAGQARRLPRCRDARADCARRGARGARHPRRAVWTRSGWKPVAASRCTRRAAEVLTAELSSGKTLTATPDHRVCGSVQRLDPDGCTHLGG